MGASRLVLAGATPGTLARGSIRSFVRYGAPRAIFFLPEAAGVADPVDCSPSLVRTAREVLAAYGGITPAPGVPMDARCRLFMPGSG